MLISYSTETCDVSGLNHYNDDDNNNDNRKVKLMKPTHDSLILRVSCLRTHQTVFNKENSYHLVNIQACEKSYCYLHNYNGRE